jgi:hypothetical protein
MKVFPDRCKCISSFLLIGHSLSILTAGAYLYFVRYNSIKNQSLDGGSYMPSLHLDYSDFQTELFISIVGCIAIFFVSLTVVIFKKPTTTCFYIIMVVLFGQFLIQTRNLANGFDSKANEMQNKVCKEDPELAR